MFLLHVAGRGVDLRHEWFDTSHPAFEGLITDPYTLPPRARWFLKPISIGDSPWDDLSPPGLRPTIARLEQARPGEVRVRAIDPTVEIFVEGARVLETLPLPVGGRLSFEGYTLRLERAAPLPAAQCERLARLAPGDDVAWRVFADEAEQSGRPDLAEWMRLERSVTNANREQLARVGATLTPSERATVGSAKVLGCTTRRCPGAWNALSVTSEPRFRDCARCKMSVPWCAQLSEAESFGKRRLPAVLDSGHEPPTRWPPPLAIG